MNKKVVLIIDADNQRTERLDFIVRLGGYETRGFSSEAAALNWVSCASLEENVLCVLCNNPGDSARAEQIVTIWSDSGRIVPIVLVQRGHCEFNSLLAIGKKDHFFVCDPESVMQTLDILSAIEYDEVSFVLPQKKSQARGEVL